ncbi:DUF6168 family protein [Formosa sp. PL04]|uniref:DUF6168 family protein n=1 Tax=Formosa sp. PL04 TaxID=3081755 RepID=UPI0029816C16|nr:DUF6168 family protein [Formosa sp. PL04]MDW5289026.1 DUF6168 family protein [Formosa sp. PL04]
MIKRILVFALCMLLLFAIGYSLHSYFISDNMSFELWQVYLYQALAALIVYVSIEYISSVLPSQTGYAYLVLMFLKLGIFVLIFKNTVFENEQLTQTERFALVVPLFLFLTAEAIAVAKLLNSK